MLGSTAEFLNGALEIAFLFVLIFRNCISNKFPGDADVAGPGNRL